MTAILQRRKDRLALRKAARHRVSSGLEAWLDTDQPTTIGTLSDTFGEKILAAAVLVLMTPSALPIPSGGATHVLDVLALLFAGQMVLARRTLWLPDRWKSRELGPKAQKAMRFVIGWIKRFERVSKPRLARLMRSRLGESALGVVLLVFVAGAFISPPFTGLDTLPALGAVLLALGILLEDAAFAIVGMMCGVGGVSLTLALGLKAGNALGHLF